MPSLRPLVALLLLAACSGPPAPPDGAVDATTPDGGTDSGAVTCGSDMACGDQSLFCMRWRCRPGEPGTDARGCIDLGPPCDPGQGCDEDRDMCGAPAWCTEGRPGCAVPGDCDNDGARAIECGGGDCDDEDMQRHPGRTEVCDAAGVDEDCNPTTVAGPSDGDGDGDTFTSAECCNGSTCGDDCNDADVNVSPSASEVCDGIDNDCSGAVDDATGLCPGGLCVAARCDFDAWDRTFGGTSSDFAWSLAFDNSGNVYVAGEARGNVDFGGGSRNLSGESLYVVKYQADGTYVWAYVSPPGGSVATADVAVEPDGSRVYVVGRASGIDLGSGTTEGAFFLALDASGSRTVDRRYGTSSCELTSVVRTSSGLLIGGYYQGSVDFGGGTRTTAGSMTGVLLRLGTDGSYVSDLLITGGGASSGRTVKVWDVADTGSGGALIGGEYSSGGLALDGSLPTAATRTYGFVVAVDGVNALRWGRALTSATGHALVRQIAVGSDGQAAAVGRYWTDLTPGTGETFTTTGPGDSNGFLVTYSATGMPGWARSIGADEGSDDANAVAIDPGNDVVVVGSFTTPTNFGGGIRSPGIRDGFFARYTSAGVHRSDFAYASGGSTGVRGVAIGPGAAVAICGEFTGMVNLGSGTRLGAGGLDAFILRLGS